MTRITKSMLQHQLKNAVINTGIKLKIRKYDKFYYLSTINNNEPLSKYGSASEIYNVLFSFNTLADFGKHQQWQKDEILELTEYHAFNVGIKNFEQCGSHKIITLEGLAGIMIDRKKESVIT